MHINEQIELQPLMSIPEYAVILAHWSYCEWYGTRNIPFRAIAQEYANRAKGKKELPYTVVALCHGLPVGMASLKENDLWSRKDLDPWLASVYVMPAYRKQGIATQLIACIVEKARKKGFGTMYLFLGQSEQSRLSAFYQKRGWQYYDDAFDNDGKKTKIFNYSL